MQEVTTATIDLEDIRSYRNAFRSRSHRAASAPAYPRIKVDISLTSKRDVLIDNHKPIQWQYHSPEEEIALGKLIKINV